MIDMTGRTVLVAGSSRGIGAATARLVSELGGDVIVHGRSDSDSLKAIAADLGAETIHCDGTDGAAVKKAAQSLESRGIYVDGLVCTLGSVTSTPPLEPLEDAWVDQYRSNVLGPVNFIQAFAPEMLARGAGAIVTVSSIRGRDNLTSPDVAAYGASKAALENVTASFAKELSPTVRVNAVAPGFVLTDMASTWSDATRAEVGTNLLRRAAQPTEIAQALVFLISGAASFITGQTILADGGFDARY